MSADLRPINNKDMAEWHFKSLCRGVTKKPKLVIPEPIMDAIMADFVRVNSAHKLFTEVRKNDLPPLTRIESRGLMLWQDGSAILTDAGIAAANKAVEWYKANHSDMNDIPPELLLAYRWIPD